MGIFDSFMPNETAGIPNGILQPQSGWQSAMQGNNPMFNIGMGILANNTGHYGAFAPALGGGVQQGIKNTQTAQTQALTSAMYKMKLEEAKKELEKQKKAQDWLSKYGEPNANKETVTQEPDSWQNAMQGTTAPNFNMERVAGQQTTTQTPYFDQNKSLLEGVKNGAIDFKDYLTLTTKDNAPLKVSAGDRFVDPKTFKEVYSAPKDPELMITPSGVAINKNDPTNIGKTFNADDNNPNKPFIMVNGQIVPNKAYQDYEIRKASAGASNVSVNTGQKGFDNTLKLRGDFRSEPIYKAHNEVQSAYSQIQAALKQASPAGDLAAATKIMKILDPGSVVRESELGMAMAASGALDRLVNYADMRIKGTKLTPAQRVDFQSLADSLYAESVKQYNTKRSEYKGISERNGLNELDVLGDSATLPTPPSNRTREDILNQYGIKK
jgi:hypothetical protein